VLLKEIITSIIYEVDYNEELKLKLINALEQVEKIALRLILE